MSHDQDAEVWINPTALPKDMRRKDPSIPREWFHLPKGAEPPTVDDLMRESSPEDQAGPRAKSPPICGRSRSKSRERTLQRKKFVDDGGYEPVGGARAVCPKPHLRTIQPLHQMREQQAEKIPPRKAFTSLPTPPTIDRSTKPVVQERYKT